MGSTGLDLHSIYQGHLFFPNSGQAWFGSAFREGSKEVPGLLGIPRFAPAKRRTSRVNAYTGLSFLRLDPQNGEFPFDVPLKPKKMGTLKIMDIRIVTFLYSKYKKGFHGHTKKMVSAYHGDHWVHGEPMGLRKTPKAGSFCSSPHDMGVRKTDGGPFFWRGPPK